MKILTFTAALMLGFAAAGTASAGTITFGTATGGNGFPFSSSAYTVEYQQVYEGSLFSGPVDITQIGFFSAPRTSGDITGNFTLHLSTTTATPSTLSLTYANNIGADNALFFSGAVSHVLSFTGTPFYFDPSAGDLLLDVLVNTANTTNNGPLAAGCSTDTNRVFNFILSSGPGAVATGNSALCNPNSFGLETQFTFTSTQVPEPPAIGLVGAGLLGLLGFAARRKRRLT